MLTFTGVKMKKFGKHWSDDGKIFVWLYKNTEKHHAGKKVVVVKSKFEKDTKPLEAFKKYAGKQVGSYTSVCRIYSCPSLKVVKKVSALKDGGKYLVVGKEYTLGVPKHTNHDFPLILVKERKKYLKEKKKKTAAKKE